jgi:hypothetical protein
VTSPTTAQDVRIGELWSAQKSILDTALSSSRALTASEKREVERLDTELDATIAERDRNKPDPLKEAIRLLDLASGPNGATRSVSADLALARAQVARDHADTTDTTIRGILDAAETAEGASARSLYCELQRHIQRAPALRTAEAFKRETMQHTSTFRDVTPYGPHFVELRASSPDTGRTASRTSNSSTAPCSRLVARPSRQASMRS